jgi:tRNA pseudouridine65 synthase
VSELERLALAGFAALHVDEALIVLSKPSGLVVHPGSSGDRLEETLLGRLRALDLGAIHTVHRLDRGTSGVLVIAREPDAARALHEAFAEGRVHKRYLALVRGLAPEEADVDYAIPKNEGGARVPARSLVRRVAHVELEGSPLREPRYSWVEVLPQTGRYHQVRRHVRHLGHPVIGDAVYGRGEHNRYLRERVGLARLALHAAHLELAHPVTGSPLGFDAPLPDDLREPLLRMGFAVDRRGPD